PICEDRAPDGLELRDVDRRRGRPRIGQLLLELLDQLIAQRLHGCLVVRLVRAIECLLTILRQDELDLLTTREDLEAALRKGSFGLVLQRTLDVEAVLLDANQLVDDDG